MLWCLLFHTVAGSIPDHPNSLKLAWDLEIKVNIMLSVFLNVAGSSCILLLVCALTPEMYIVKGGMSSVSALQSVEYKPTFLHCRPAVLLCYQPPLLKCW